MPADHRRLTTDVLRLAAIRAKLKRDHEAQRKAPPVQSLGEFVRRTMAGYLGNWHTDVLAARLDRWVDTPGDRLIVVMPPRHSKTEHCSRRLPAYLLGRDPSARIIACSYAASLSLAIARDVHGILSHPSYQAVYENFALAPPTDKARASTVGYFTPAGSTGYYLATSVGGSLTGYGYTYGIIDDYLRNAADAASPRIRDAQWQWYGSVFRTRAEPGARILVVATRWHEDDLIGRLLEAARKDSLADQWDVLHFPALQDRPPSELDPRQEGEPLWPARFDRQALEAMAATLGHYAFEALYQGRPTPQEGAMVQSSWWRTWNSEHLAQGMDLVVHAWDTAFGSRQGNDYSVGAIWGVNQHGYFLLDLWRGQPDYPALRQQVLAQAVREDWPADAVLIEAAASGRPLLDDLQASTRLPLVAYTPRGDKAARVAAQSPKIEAGRVYLPPAAPWLAAFLAEHAQFPRGEHDDQVDTTAMALEYLGARAPRAGRAGAVVAPAPPDRLAPASRQRAGAALVARSRRR